MQVLFNLNNKINTIYSIYSIKLDFIIWKTNIGAQKIIQSTLKRFNIAIASFPL